MSILGEVGDALQRLRCNAWRFNAETKRYDRVDEDVKVVEDRIKELETQAAKDTRGGALQAMMYVAEVERADRAEAEVADLANRNTEWCRQLNAALGQVGELTARVKQLEATQEAYESDAKLSRKMIGERGIRCIEHEHALRLAKSYIGSLTGKEVPGIKGLAALPVLFAIDKAMEKS